MGGVRTGDHGVVACWVTPAPNPTSVLPAIRAFHDIRPLTAAEAEALWPLLVLRTAVLIVSGAQQAALDPDNDYITEQSDGEWRMFEQATSVPMDVMTDGDHGRTSALRPSPRAVDVATPLVAGVDPASVVTLDLSPTSDVYDVAFVTATGCDADVEDELARAAVQNGARLVVTRFGQPRLSRTPQLSQDSPDVVATGISAVAGSSHRTGRPVGRRGGGPLRGRRHLPRTRFRADACRGAVGTASGAASVPATRSPMRRRERWVDARRCDPSAHPPAPLLTRRSWRRVGWR